MDGVAAGEEEADEPGSGEKLPRHEHRHLRQLQDMTAAAGVGKSRALDAGRRKWDPFLLTSLLVAVTAANTRGSMDRKELVQRKEGGRGAARQRWPATEQATVRRREDSKFQRRGKTSTRRGLRSVSGKRRGFFFGNLPLRHLFRDRGSNCVQLQSVKCSELLRFFHFDLTLN